MSFDGKSEGARLRFALRLCIVEFLLFTIGDLKFALCVDSGEASGELSGDCIGVLSRDDDTDLPELGLILSLLDKRRCAAGDIIFMRSVSDAFGESIERFGELCVRLRCTHLSASILRLRLAALAFSSKFMAIFSRSGTSGILNSGPLPPCSV